MLSDRVAALEPSIIRQMANRRKPSSINLSLGEPALPPDAELLERAWTKLRSGEQGYTHNAGLIELRAAFAEHHRLEGRAAPENVIVTVGSEQAVFLALTTVLNPGDEVLVPDPGYPAYRGIARLMGAVPVPFTISLDSGLAQTHQAIAAAITPKTRAIVINTPSNPFGTSVATEDLKRIAELAEARGLMVISDEIYRDLYYGREAPGSICEHTRQSIFIGGLSKSCAMTGLRLGYFIADVELTAKATLAHQLMVTCAPRLAQLAALEVLAQPGMLRAHVPYYAEAREALESLRPSLPQGIEMHLGDGAFYAILDVSAHAKGDPLALAIELAEREDVIVVPGTAFGSGGDWFWRLSYASGAAAVREGLTRITRFFEERS